jgi:hypothetical protein
MAIEMANPSAMDSRALRANRAPYPLLRAYQEWSSRLGKCVCDWYMKVGASSLVFACNLRCNSLRETANRLGLRSAGGLRRVDSETNAERAPNELRVKRERREGMNARGHG